MRLSKNFFFYKGLCVYEVCLAAGAGRTAPPAGACCRPYAGCDFKAHILEINSHGLCLVDQFFVGNKLKTVDIKHLVLFRWVIQTQSQ
jgi:hypothetical protein